MNDGIHRKSEPRPATTMKPLAGHDFLLQFFSYDHLPLDKQEVSRPFGELAKSIVASLPSNPERAAALRKLLEAKDCAVRASIANTVFVLLRSTDNGRDIVGIYSTRQKAAAALLAWKPTDGVDTDAYVEELDVDPAE